MDIAIKEVMTPSPHSIAGNQSLRDALNVMRKHEIRHLPVRRGQDIYGILSERDIDFASRVDKLSLDEIEVVDACVIDPYVVNPETKVSEVSRTMGHRGIGCALIVDKNDLVGIFTSVDACKLLAEALSGRPEQ